MSYTQIIWKNKKLTKFTGRNGYFNCSGIQLYSDNTAVMINPTTSKGEVGNCSIEIPIESIDEVINILKQLKNK